MKLKALIATAVLAGCSTQADMDALPIQRTTEFDQNYQQIYANLNKGTRNCMQIGGFNVDGQLYSDLGYGEVTAAGGTGLSYVPMVYGKVSKSGSGSVLQSKTIMKKDSVLNWVDYWARGGITCPKIHYGETPPSS